jgi:hypothetical protein
MTPIQKAIVKLEKLDHDALVKKLAWEVARNVIDHHKNVYSKIFEAAPSTFPVSMRNAIYNEIQSAIKCHTDEQIQSWIARSEEHRKTMRRLKALQRKAKAARGDKEKTDKIISEIMGQ